MNSPVLTNIFVRWLCKTLNQFTILTFSIVNIYKIVIKGLDRNSYRCGGFFFQIPVLFYRRKKFHLKSRSNLSFEYTHQDLRNSGDMSLVRPDVSLVWQLTILQKMSNKWVVEQASAQHDRQPSCSTTHLIDNESCSTATYSTVIQFGVSNSWLSRWFNRCPIVRHSRNKTNYRISC